MVAKSVLVRTINYANNLIKCTKIIQNGHFEKSMKKARAAFWLDSNNVSWMKKNCDLKLTCQNSKQKMSGNETISLKSANPVGTSSKRTNNH